MVIRQIAENVVLRGDDSKFDVYRKQFAAEALAVRDELCWRLPSLSYQRRLGVYHVYEKAGYVDCLLEDLAKLVEEFGGPRANEFDRTGLPMPMLPRGDALDDLLESAAQG